MNYRVTLHAGYDRLLMASKRANNSPTNLPDEETAYAEELDIIQQVDGDPNGMKSYDVPVKNMAKLLNLVAEFNIREDKDYIMKLEVYSLEEESV